MSLAGPDDPIGPGSPVGPASPPRSRVWAGAQILADDADGPAIADLFAQHTDAFAWAVVDPGDTERIDGVIGRVGLDDWVRQDLTATGGRPAQPVPGPYARGHHARHPERPLSEPRPQIKYEQFDRVQLVISAAVELAKPARNRNPLIIRRVAIVITPRLLLVVAGDEDRGLLSRHLIDLQSRLADGGTERAAQGVLHALAGSYFTVVEEIESASDELADSLFDLQPLDGAEKGTVFRLRRTVTELRRVTGPMREVVQSLGQNSDEDPGSISRSWNLLIEHQNSVSAAADDLRDSLGALFDTSLAFDDSRMNEVMKKLTGWAAIIAAPTLITGFVGMNVPFWGNGAVQGFYVYLGIMLAASVLLFALFKRLKWI